MVPASLAMFRTAGAAHICRVQGDDWRARGMGCGSLAQGAGLLCFPFPGPLPRRGCQMSRQPSQALGQCPWLFPPGLAAPSPGYNSSVWPRGTPHPANPVPSPPPPPGVRCPWPQSLCSVHSSRQPVDTSGLDRPGPPPTRLSLMLGTRGPF